MTRSFGPYSSNDLADLHNFAIAIAGLTLHKVVSVAVNATNNVAVRFRLIEMTFDEGGDAAGSSG